MKILVAMQCLTDIWVSRTPRKVKGMSLKQFNPSLSYIDTNKRLNLWILATNMCTRKRLFLCVSIFVFSPIKIQQFSPSKFGLSHIHVCVHQHLGVWGRFTTLVRMTLHRYAPLFPSLSLLHFDKNNSRFHHVVHDASKSWFVGSVHGRGLWTETCIKKLVPWWWFYRNWNNFWRKSKHKNYSKHKN